MTTCPKCGADSGNNWSQCKGSCPMPGSPHYAVAQAGRVGAVKGLSPVGGPVTDPPRRTRLVAFPMGSIRYCPECGRTGEVDPSHRDCCPDGGRAVYVPLAVAEQASIGFREQLKTPDNPG